MFDRKVHNIAEDGTLRSVNPFTEIVRQGYPNCLIRNRKAYTADGASYPKQYLTQEIIESYHLTDYMSSPEPQAVAKIEQPNEGFHDDVSDSELDEFLDKPKKRGRKKKEEVEQ